MASQVTFSSSVGSKRLLARSGLSEIASPGNCFFFCFKTSSSSTFTPLRGPFAVLSDVFSASKQKTNTYVREHMCMSSGIRLDMNESRGWGRLGTLCDVCTFLLLWLWWPHGVDDPEQALCKRILQWQNSDLVHLCVHVCGVCVVCVCVCVCAMHP